MKRLIKIVALLSLGVLMYACSSADSDEIKVSIVLPIEHQAMNEIVAGFKDSLKKNYDKPVKVSVANGQGDANILRAIIQQLRDENVRVIATVGMGPTQMAMSMVKSKPIVGVAANLPQKARTVSGRCHLALVHDEVPPATELSFLHAAFPKIHNIVLVHSATDKVFPQVKESVAAGKKLGMTVTPKVVNTLADLYSIAQTLPQNTQAIFILKDNLVASGIATLAKLANDRHIPLVSSDEGTVQEGAGFALGITERSSGEEGGVLVAKILKGDKPCDLPIVTVKKLQVFMNTQAMIKQTMSAGDVVDAAQKLNYHVVHVVPGGQ